MEFKPPKIEDKIYVPSEHHHFKDEIDFEGGLATISGVVFKRKPTYLSFIENKDEWLIEIQARPDTYYDYRILLSRQKELREEYKGRMAHIGIDHRDYSNEESINPYV